jgi:hypothetical protein
MQEPDIRDRLYPGPETVWEVFSDLARWGKLDPARPGGTHSTTGTGARLSVRVRLRPPPAALHRAFVALRQAGPSHDLERLGHSGLIGLEIERTFAPTGNEHPLPFDLRRRGRWAGSSCSCSAAASTRSSSHRPQPRARAIGARGPGLFDTGNDLSRPPRSKPRRLRPV